ncbi:hypothetical protein CFI00_08755 [Nocardioides sp. S5]|nr:DUF6629 family protein [Nocardioides sp. S5]QSR30592.1 hypothetical protein CFI00_08755 [Nocardioides sp. S5]
MRGDSIAYDSPHFYLTVVLEGYLLATCISGLFSSHWCIKVFGMLAFILAIAAAVVSLTTFVSVWWCFYAAILSLLVYVHFSGPNVSLSTPDAAARPRQCIPRHAHEYTRWKNGPMTMRHRASQVTATGTRAEVWPPRSTVRLERRSS